MAGLAPEAISPTGTIRVNPTLQIRDEKLPNVYVCGDVAAVGIDNPNARSAMRQGMVVGLNVVRAATGSSPTKTYEPFWGEGVIKLTLGLVRRGKSPTLAVVRANRQNRTSRSLTLGLGRRSCGGIAKKETLPLCLQEHGNGRVLSLLKTRMKQRSKSSEACRARHHTRKWYLSGRLIKVEKI